MTKLITIDGELYLRAFGEDKKVLKGWESMTGWYWFATELNVHSDKGYHFGYVQGSYPEWGYFTENELNSIKTVWPIKDIDLPHAGRRDA
jgi:hypothetical protein